MLGDTTRRRSTQFGALVTPTQGVSSKMSDLIELHGNGHKRVITPWDRFKAFFEYLLLYSEKWLEVWDQNSIYGSEGEEAEEEAERLEYLHEEFEWFELFFDLIFVAYVVELAWLLKTSDYLESDDDKWWRGVYSAVLFTSAWQTWNHINYLTTRFVIRIKLSFLIFAAVMIFVSLLSVEHLPDNEHGHPQYTDGLGQRAANIAQVVSRLFLLYFYWVARVEISITERRFEVDVYLTFFAVSTLLLIAGAALEEPHDSNSRRALWAVSVLTELPMYFVAEKLAKTKATNVLFGSKDDRDILEAVVPVECESRNQKKPNVFIIRADKTKCHSKKSIEETARAHSGEHEGSYEHLYGTRCVLPDGDQEASVTTFIHHVRFVASYVCQPSEEDTEGQTEWMKIQSDPAASEKPTCLKPSKNPIWYWRRREETLGEVEETNEDSEAETDDEDDLKTTDRLAYEEGPYAECDGEVDGVTIRSQRKTWHAVNKRKYSAFSLRKSLEDSVAHKEIVFNSDVTLRVGRTVYLRQFTEKVEDIDAYHEARTDETRHDQKYTQGQTRSNRKELVGTIGRIEVIEKGTAVRITLADVPPVQENRFVDCSTGEEKKDYRYVSHPQPEGDCPPLSTQELDEDCKALVLCTKRSWHFNPEEAKNCWHRGVKTDMEHYRETYGLLKRSKMHNARKRWYEAQNSAVATHSHVDEAYEAYSEALEFSWQSDQWKVWDLKTCSEYEEVHFQRVGDVKNRLLPLQLSLLVKRMELWLVIVTGEAVLAIVTASSENTDDFARKDTDPQKHYYFNMLLAIFIVVLLLAIYETARPKRQSDADKFAVDSLSPSDVLIFNFTHLVSTFGMLLVSVAMKLIMYNMAHDERFSRYHAGLLCIGITVYLMGLNVSRLSDVWASSHLVPGARWAYRVIHTLLSVSFVGLMWAVGHTTCNIEDVSHSGAHGSHAPTAAGAGTHAPSHHPTHSPTAHGAHANGATTDHHEEQCWVQDGISAQELMAIILVMLLVIWLLEQLLAPSPAEHGLHHQKREASLAHEDRARAHKLRRSIRKRPQRAGAVKRPSASVVTSNPLVKTSIV